VLNFAVLAGIRRVVMTSSVAAIGYGHKGMGVVANFNVDDWTDVEGLKGSWTYSEAKARAEKRAWEIAREKNIDLTCICPSMVFGPAVDTDTSASLEIVSRLLNGQVPALPPGGLSVVDVRDVAQIHVDALKNSKTIGKRIISSAEYISFKKIAEILRAEYPGVKLPNATAPLWLMKIVGWFSASVKQIAADLETVRYYDGQPGAELMGRDYRTGREATLCAAESLIELGMIELPR
jgi:dihydroflavonol-4-reductase